MAVSANVKGHVTDGKGVHHKPEDLSSSPKTHIKVEGKNSSTKLSSVIHIYSVAHVSTHISCP